MITTPQTSRPGAQLIPPTHTGNADIIIGDLDDPMNPVTVEGPFPSRPFHAPPFGTLLDPAELDDALSEQIDRELLAHPPYTPGYIPPRPESDPLATVPSASPTLNRDAGGHQLASD